MRQKYKLNAFTLAEVLIALMVIGVLAVITIPSILQSWEERATVTQLLKTYSLLQQAYKMAEIEYGTPDTWGEVTSHLNGINNIMNFVKIAKNCQNSSCPVINYTYLNSPTTNVFTSSGKGMFLLNDGSSVVYILRGANCKGEYYGYYQGEGICGVINIDTNGFKKPNVAGKDLFQFILVKDGIKPMGGSNSDYVILGHNVHCKNTSSAGLACAKWVIERKNMNYLNQDTTW